MKVSNDINLNLSTINDILPVKKSFDIITREIIVDNKKSFILFVDGFIKDSIMVHIMKELQKVADQSIDSSKKIFLQNIPYIEVTIENDLDITEGIVVVYTPHPCCILWC